MIIAALLPTEGHAEVALALPTWAFGAITLAIFAVLLIVLLSFRDVADRHRTPAPGAHEHVAMPGADHHGDGHPRSNKG